jgi:hypothetical protein
MIEHSKKMNIFFFMAGLHLKAQPLWGYWDNSGVDEISQYPFLFYLRSIRVNLIYGKVASPVLCPGFFTLSRIHRTLFTIANSGRA